MRWWAIARPAVSEKRLSLLSKTTQASFAMASTEWLVFGPQGDIEKDMSNAVITERQQYWLDHIKAAEDREGTLSNK